MTTLPKIKKVGVVGMGYVGVPMAALFSTHYDHVYGIQRESERSKHKIALLNEGKSPFTNEPLLEDILTKSVKSKKFSCHSDFSVLHDVDAITLSIQTPFENIEKLKPDYEPLNRALDTVSRVIKEQSIIVIESTITPGYTESIAKEILEQGSGLRSDRNFFLAHAPERIMNGKLIHNIQNCDRIVGGIDNDSTLAATELYKPVMKQGVIIQMSAREAEISKTTENAMRDLQIATSNQLALYCESMGVNFYNIKSGVDSLDKIGCTRALLYPGAGVGGHCLTKDSYHLERGLRISKKYNFDFPQKTESLFMSARKINDFMPSHMFDLAVSAFARSNSKHPMTDQHITILGFAFNADTDDDRNSPADTLYSILRSHGFKNIDIHDPYIKSQFIHNDIKSALSNADIIFIMTGHSMYKKLDPLDMKQIMGIDHPIIIDGRNVIDANKFINHGYIYKGIGRGDVNHHPIHKDL